MIKESPMNHLDAYTLSLRIAPSVLCGHAASDALYGNSASRKVRGSDFCLLGTKLELLSCNWEYFGKIISATGDLMIAFFWSGVEYVSISFRKIWEGRLLI